MAGADEDSASSSSAAHRRREEPNDITIRTPKTESNLGTPTEDGFKHRGKGKSVATSAMSVPPRAKKRTRTKTKADPNSRQATIRSLDYLGLPIKPLASSAKPPTLKRGPGKGKKRGATRRKADPTDDDGGASSGDEYAGNLLDTYIGQVGACCAMGFSATDVINLEAWERFTEEERESLRSHLPKSLSASEKEETARRLVSGNMLYFGNPLEQVFHGVAAGVTHPRVRRWRLRVTLIERRHHMLTLRDYHNRYIRRLLARKACKESAEDALAGLAAVGGNLTKTGGALQALPGRIDATAEAAAQSSMNEWDAERWRRVLDFRNQETARYKVPHRAFPYRNPWGHSVVGPLKRGPAIDGGRPREHVLLRNERPSHVTILCIVRDAASRLPNNRGTRADICELLRDSQYLREGATFQQLNTVVSGALDRLHYEDSAPVRYDAESKEWCYLHNDMRVDDFERPAWAKEAAVRREEALLNESMGNTHRVKSKKKRKKKN